MGIIETVKNLLEENSTMTPLLAKKVELLDETFKNASDDQKKKWKEDFEGIYRQLVHMHHKSDDYRNRASKTFPNTLYHNDENIPKKIQIPGSLQLVQKIGQAKSTVDIAYSLWFLRLPEKWIEKMIEKCTEKTKSATKNLQISMLNNNSVKPLLISVKLGIIYSFFYDKEKSDSVVSEVLSLVTVLDKVEVKIVIWGLADKINLNQNFQHARYLIDGLTYLIKNVLPQFIESKDIFMVLDRIDSLFANNSTLTSGNEAQTAFFALSISKLLDAVLDVVSDAKIEMKQRSQKSILQNYRNFLQTSANEFLKYQYIYTSQAIIHISIGNKYLGNNIDEDQPHDWFKKLQNARCALQSGNFNKALYSEIQESLPQQLNQQKYFQLGIYHLLMEVLTMSSYYIQHADYLNDVYRLHVIRNKIHPLDDNLKNDDLLSILKEIEISDNEYPFLENQKLPKPLTLASFQHFTELHPLLEPGKQLGMLLSQAKELVNKKMNPMLFLWKNGISYFSYETPELVPIKCKNYTKYKYEHLKYSQNETSDQWNLVDTVLNHLKPKTRNQNQNFEENCPPKKNLVFDQHNQKVILIHGDAGSGKSKFCKSLLMTLWDIYHSFEDKSTERFIPVYVNLLEVVDDKQYGIDSLFIKMGIIKDAEINTIKSEHKFIILYDGYDEAQLNINPHTNTAKGLSSHTHIIISCRSENLVLNHKAIFHDGKKPGNYLEARITPFDDTQIKELVEKYVSLSPISLDAAKILHNINSANSLVTLKKNLLFLKFTLKTIQDESPFSLHQFETVIKNWVNRHFKLISEMKLKDDLKQQFYHGLPEQTFMECLKHLKAAIIKEKNLEIYTTSQEILQIIEKYMPKNNNQHLQHSTPITQIVFPNIKIISDYVLYCIIFDRYRELNQLPNEEYNGLLECYSFCKETSVIQFLADKANDDPLFKKQLWSVIEESKAPSIQQNNFAAANSITILVKSGEHFENKNLKSIKIKSADLSNGNFNGAEFNNADLTDVNFHNSDLTGATFNNAIIKGITIGHLDNIPKEILSATFRDFINSPDPKTFKDNFQLAYNLFIFMLPEDVKDMSIIEKDWLEKLKAQSGDHLYLETIAGKIITDFVSEDPISKDAISEALCYSAVYIQDQKQIIDHLIKDPKVTSPLQSIQAASFLIANSQAEASTVTKVEIENIIKYLDRFKINLTEDGVSDYIQSISYLFDSLVDFKQDSSMQRSLKDKKFSNSLKELLTIDVQKLNIGYNALLVYQIAYALQALLYILDENSSFDVSFKDKQKKSLSSFKVICQSKIVDVQELKRTVESIKYQSGPPKVSDTSLLGSICSLDKIDKELAENLTAQSIDTKKSGWYLALRGCDALIQCGLFADLKSFILDISYKNDVAFQLGICQRLGSIALNNLLDMSVCQSAVDLLIDICHSNLAEHGWKTWIITKEISYHILNDILQRQSAIKSLVDMIMKPTQVENYSTNLFVYPMIPIYKADSNECRLLLDAERKSSADPALEKLKTHCVNNYSTEKTDNYIHPKAEWPGSSLTEFDLLEEMHKFASSENKDKKVFLLLGEAGIGKSSFTKEFENQLWKDSDKPEAPIPLFISLPAFIKHGDGKNNKEILKDLIGHHLKNIKTKRMNSSDKAEGEKIFHDDEIDLLKKKKKNIVLICDGYDEINELENLYDINEFEQKGWKVKMIISCRTEYTASYTNGKYKTWFRPGHSKNDGLVEATVVPFSRKQIDDYIDKYTAGREKISKDIKKALYGDTEISDLATNPFLLKLIVDMLSQGTIRGKITRIELYDQFVTEWLDRSRLRMEENKSKLSPHERDYFDKLSKDHEKFITAGFKYLIDLAATISIEQKGTNVGYNQNEIQPEWKHRFFNSNKPENVLRHAIPLVKFVGGYKFVHKTVLEYGLVRYMFKKNTPISGIQSSVESNDSNEQSVSRRGSVDSFINNDETPIESDTLITTPEQLITSPFGELKLFKFPTTMSFLVGCVLQSKDHIDLLQDLIQYSKDCSELNSKPIKIASANAISILVKAGISFSKRDLSGVKIPKANLEGGIFDSTDFRNADLQDVNFENSWIQSAKFEGANMSGVKFKKDPDLLIEDYNIKSTAYSPNGRFFAVGLTKGHVKIYDTSLWECKFVINPGDEHMDISTLLFTNDSSHIITVGKTGKVIRIWNIESDEAKLANNLPGKDGIITSFVYSAKKEIVVIGSSDNSVYIYDLKEKDVSGIEILIHLGEVNCVALVYDDEYIISASEDRTIMLTNIKNKYDIKSYDLLKDWKNEKDEKVSLEEPVLHFVTSPTGKYFASYNCTYIFMWEAYDSPEGTVGSLRPIKVQKLIGSTVEVGTLLFSPDDSQFVITTKEENKSYLGEVLKGKDISCKEHDRDITTAVYSCTGDQLALGTTNGNIKIWDTRIGYIETFAGYQDKIQSISFSPNASQVVASYRNRVRMWPLAAEQDRSQSVKTVWITISPNNEFIVSGGQEKYVHVWDPKNNKYLHHIDCQSEVVKVAFSPNGKEMVSGGVDHKVRLWDISKPVELYVFDGHSGGITCVAYSAKGKWIASGSKDKTVRVWDRHSKDCITLTDHRSPIVCIEISSESSKDNNDADLLASGCVNGEVRIWNLDSGKCLQSLLHRSKTNLKTTSSINSTGITCIAFSPDGQYLASGDNINTICVWEVSTGRHLYNLEGHSAAISTICFTGESNNLVSASHDGYIKVWNYEASTQRYCQSNAYSEEAHARGVLSIACSKGSDYFVTSGQDNKAKIWNLTTQECETVIDNHSKSVTSVCFNGVSVVTAGLDMKMYIRDIDGTMTQPLNVLRQTPSDITQNNRLYNQHNSETNVETKNERQYGIIRFPSLGQHQILLHQGPWQIWGYSNIHNGYNMLYSTSKSIKYSILDIEIAIAGADLEGLFDLDNSNKDQVLLHDQEINMLISKPLEASVLFCDSQNKLWVWNTGETQCKLYIDLNSNLEGNKDQVTSIAFSESGDYLIVRMSKQMQLWRTQSTQITPSMICSKVLDTEVPCASTSRILFSPNNKSLITITGGDVHVWYMVFSGNEIQGIRYSKYLGKLSSDQEWVTYINGGNRVIFIGEDKKFQMHKCNGVEDPKHIEQFNLNQDCSDCSSVAYLPSKEWIATGDSSGTICIWNLKNSNSRSSCIKTFSSKRGTTQHISWRGPENLITCDHKSLCCWKLEEKNGVYSVYLMWTSSQETLEVSGASFQKNKLRNRTAAIFNQNGANIDLLEQQLSKQL